MTTETRPLHLFETGCGEDWILAYDKADALAQITDWSGEDFAEESGVEQIPDDQPWSMYLRPGELSDPVAQHPEATVVLLDGALAGDGFTHRVTAPAWVWCAFGVRGPIASSNY